MSPGARKNDPTMTYRAVRRFARAVLSFFYSTIEVTGDENVDTSWPTIYAPTHPNSVIDPLLLVLFEDRPIRFVAKHDLFKVPIFGSILRSIGAIPVKRRSDHGNKSVDNTESLAACSDVLKNGGVLVIFPEGKTHARLRVEPLKTGVARIAFDAEQDLSLGLRIVPVGLNYLVRHAFRSDVHVGVGTPIVVDEDLRSEYDADPQAAVRKLTARVEEDLRALTVHIEREDDERMIAQVLAIVAELREEEGLDPEGQSPAERVALAQRVLDAYRWMEGRDPERTATLRRRILDLLDERKALGLGGENPALQHRSDRRRTVRVWREDKPILIALGAPFAAYGIATHAVPYLFMRLLLVVSPPRVYQAALIKLLAGALIFAAWYAVTTTFVFFGAGPIAASLYAMSLIPTALFARRYLAEIRLHRLGPSWVWRFFRHKGRLAMLRAERKMLADELATLRREYLATIGDA
jgi:glycerol-3-phosphate O-acyltransferase / dihydroxyacetone phosphate acyltransferase